jgi:hypothetical protein
LTVAAGIVAAGLMFAALAFMTGGQLISRS